MPQQIYTQFTLSEEYQGKRLDVALACLLPDYSRAQIQTWIKHNQIQINHQPAKNRTIVRHLDRITIHAELPLKALDKAQPLPLDIVHEDDQLLVVNKPANLVVHPGAGQSDQTLVNALLYYHPPLAQLPRAGLVHRLDKNTSGLLLIAKTPITYHHLQHAMQHKAIARHYQAIVVGQVISGGTIDAPIGRHAKHRLKMAVTPLGKPAITHFRVEERFYGYTHLHVELDTGRTHQIRVHLAHLNYPVVGDPTYQYRYIQPKGLDPQIQQCIGAFKRQALHAKYLSFIHPTSQLPLHLQAPPPADMVHLLSMLRQTPYDPTS